VGGIVATSRISVCGARSTRKKNPAYSLRTHIASHRIAFDISPLNLSCCLCRFPSVYFTGYETLKQYWTRMLNPTRTHGGQDGTSGSAACAKDGAPAVVGRTALHEKVEMVPLPSYAFPVCGAIRSGQADNRCTSTTTRTRGRSLHSCVSGCVSGFATRLSSTALLHFLLLRC
jgi:hypothetical protein